MASVSDDLDMVQARLHDAGALWPRAELLRWYNDGYRDLLALSQAVRRLRLLDLPGRHTYAITHEWEDRHTTGTVRKPTRTVRAGWGQGTALWESEHLTNLDPTAALVGFTHDWERAFTTESDRHYRFSFPKNHERIARVMWNERRLSPVSVRELDETDVAWQKRVGEPRWWTTGVGRITSIEVYEIRTDYGQQYELQAYEQGIPRSISGERAYATDGIRHPNVYAYTSSGDSDAIAFSRLTIRGAGLRCTVAAQTPAQGFGTQVWEAELLNGAATFSVGIIRGCFPWEVEFGAAAITLALGSIRSVVSPGRQYLGVGDAAGHLTGSIRDWRSSADSLAVLEVLVPDTVLAEEDTPAWMPAPLTKYLRYYVLARAFGRVGEGHNTVLADHFQRRFLRGVGFFQRLADVAHKDRVYRRDMVTPQTRRIARVTLPSEFPAVFG